jgi:hypothetical protein
LLRDVGGEGNSNKIRDKLATTKMAAANLKHPAAWVLAIRRASAKKKIKEHSRGQHGGEKLNQ